MELVKYLIKDLIWDFQKNQLSEEGSEQGDQIASVNQWLEESVRQQILHNYNLDIQNIKINKEYYITVEDKIDEFLDHNPDDYLRKTELGEQMAFSEASGTLKDIGKLIEARTDFDFSKTPEGIQMSIFSEIENTLELMRQIKNFHIALGDATSERHRISQELRNAYNNLFNLWNQIGPARIDNNERGSLDLNAQKKEAEAAVKAIQGFEQQAEQAAKATASTAGKVGAKKEAQHFSDESDAHNENAKRWFFGSVVGGLGLISIAVYFYFCEPLPEADNFAWNHFVPRFSILGLLIFFEVVLIGNYKAERHNSIVNKHRANALKTFETMITAARSDGAKDAITLTAATAIYAPQETGFRGGGSAQMRSSEEILAAIIQNRTE